MKPRTWIILGATSIIAEKFAHLAATAGHSLRLVGRDQQQLELITQDIQLRFHVPCTYIVMQTNELATQLTTIFKQEDIELDLFIAHSDFTENDELNPITIKQLLETNILNTTLLIHTYWQLTQEQHNLLYLSSVAACRGRSKNSLYGASKAAIEVYLQGLQQGATSNQHITIARLGFIDTKQTYGLPGIFYAAPPEDCAQACWNAINRRKRMFYFPSFWRVIMSLINHLPFFLYKKMGKI